MLRVKMCNGVFQILEQNFREFDNNGYEGIVRCCNYPDIEYDHHQLIRIYLRGDFTRRDNSKCLYNKADKDTIKRELEYFCKFYNHKLIIEDYDRRLGEIR